MFIPLSVYKGSRHPKTRLLPLCILLLLFGCHQTNGLNSLYFKNVLRQTDSTARAEKRAYSGSDLKTIDAALAIVKNPNPIDLGMRYYIIANYYAANQTLDTAAIYADSSVFVLKNHLLDTACNNLYILVNLYKGECDEKLQKFDAALYAYTIAKMAMPAAAEKPVLLRRYYNDMSGLYYHQGNFLKAIPYYKLNTGIMPACSKNTLEIAEVTVGNLYNTGDCFGKAGFGDSAYYYFNATLNYIENCKKRIPEMPKGYFESSRAVAYGNLAETRWRQHNIKEAEMYFVKCYATYQFADDQFYLRYLRLSLAGIYLQTKQTKKAHAILQLLSHSFDSPEISASSQKYYTLLSDYYYSLNQLPAANQALQHAGGIADSIKKRDRHFVATDIALASENSEQKNINALLTKDNALKKGYLLAGITAALLVFLFAVLFAVYLKRKSSYIKKLSFLNTELNHQNHDLQKTMDSLEQSHTENKHITRSIAHDLKNPISAIRTMVHSMAKNERDGTGRESLELIETTCVESISLIRDLLSQKTDESGIHKELVDIGRLIEQCIELFQSKASEKKQQLKLQVDHPVVMLNRQNIWRVVSNIVNNAIKFSPENSDISVRLERMEDFVLLSVHDKGIGIPGYLKDKIFSVSAEKSRAGTAGEASYGMGLSISQQIIEDHNGRLWFESEAGNGCAFYVELPYHSN